MLVSTLEVEEAIGNTDAEATTEERPEMPGNSEQQEQQDSSCSEEKAHKGIVHNGISPKWNFKNDQTIKTPMKS
eukprot:761364-Amphidinium_carterae.1